MQLSLSPKRMMAGLGAAAALGSVLFLGAGSASAQTPAPTPPSVPASSVQKPAIPADSAAHKAKTMAPLGKTATRSKLSASAAASLADANVYFNTPYKYCSNFMYLPVTNTAAATKYYEIVLYTSNDTRTFYGSVAANSTSYPYFYGVTGNYTAYLYVWDGSSYSYDSYSSSSLNCSVSVTSTRSGNYLLLTVKNTGNTYASVKTAELAPYPSYGTYTGEHWVYPAAGTGVAYQWYYLGATGTPYAVIADNSGSTSNAWTFTGVS